jgi:general secretion pathway protein G
MPPSFRPHAPRDIIGETAYPHMTQEGSTSRMSMFPPLAPKHPSPRRRPGGFTLLEILVVIVVIALLATLVAPNVFRHVGAAQDATARSQIEMLGAALDAYRLPRQRPLSHKRAGPRRPLERAPVRAASPQLARSLSPQGSPTSIWTNLRLTLSPVRK